jgi:hypothetical protein
MKMNINLFSIFFALWLLFGLVMYFMQFDYLFDPVLNNIIETITWITP